MLIRSFGRHLCVLVVPAIAMAACGKGDEAPAKIDSALTASQSAARSKDVIHALSGGISFIGKDDSVLMKLVGGSSGAVAIKAIRSPLPSSLTETLQDTPVLRVMRPHPMPSMLTAQEQLDDSANDLAVFIQDRLLVESNIETKTDIEVTYLLKPAPTCNGLPSSGSTAPNPDCVRDLPKLQVRVVARADGDGARFQILLGPDKLELSVLIIHSDLLGWEADLAKAKKAVDFANATLGKSGSDPFPFSKLQGRIKVALQKTGDKKVTASFGVLEPLDLEATNPALAFKTAKSDPLISLTADGAGQQATIKLNIAQTDVRAPWDPKGTGARNLDLLISSGGLYGETTLSESSKELSLKGLGIGQTFVAVRGTHIFDLDFNPANGRKFDLVAKVVGNDVPHIEVTPKFDLSLAFKLKAVAAEFDSAPPKELLDETYTVTFVPGGSPPAILEAVKSTATFGGGMKVVAGTLTLATSSSAAATVTVPTGKCLVGNDAPAMGSHAILGHLATANCP